MSDLPLHPIFIHLPLALSTIMPVYFLIILLFQNKIEIKIPRYIAAIFQFLILLSAIPAYLTGEYEKKFSTAASDILISHQENAIIFSVSSIFPLVFIVLSVFKNHSLASKKTVYILDSFAFLFSLLVLYFAIKVGHLGGTITYG